MNRVVFDIETLAYPLEHFDELQQEYLLRFAKTDEEREEAIQKLSLTPFTARIVAIAMLNPESNRGKVFYDGPGEKPELVEDGFIEYAPMPEPEMLEEFWKTILPYGQFITFNGRSFDCPFVMLRSAALGVKPSRNLMPYRYSANEHCDLLDQLTFYGASRKFNLDFYCKAFGIRSPKAEGISGHDVAALHAAGRFRDIATYCMGDVKATAQLFHRWQSLLSIEK
ncbi:MAG: 3'-5' exonuclease, PolB [Bacteroidetes bacterium]|nr:3'-5' exonuclease, PolB [Bacteroidota bacterium]